MSTNPDAPSAENRSETNDLHQGYDLEAGVLARVREWTDVFPWLRLGRTLRVAASPPLVLLTAVVFAIWCCGVALIGGVDGSSGIGPGWQTGTVAIDPMRLPASLSESLRNVTTYLQGLTTTSVFNGDGFGGALIKVVWSAFVWTPLAMFLAKQGALLTAGRAMAGMGPGLALVTRRTPTGWLTAFVPLACVVVIGSLIFVLGWLARFTGGVAILEGVFGIAMALVAIPCGVLAFGAQVAVPLGWAALANERDADALDSLSRGYEYLFRRPLSLAWYVFLSFSILLVVGTLASAIADAAISVAGVMVRAAGSPMGVQYVVSAMLSCFPSVVVLTLLWSLVGGVYLLLRCDAGGQEVEDIWHPAPPPTSPLPQLP